MSSKNQVIHELDPATVAVFISRDRDAAAEALAIEHQREHGQLQPGKVRDIRSLPPEQRKRPGGGLYDYQLVYGQGRLERAKKLKRPFRAVVEQMSDPDAVVDFLAENFNRKPLPVMERARLIADDLRSGKTVEQLSEELHLSTEMVRKYDRILRKAAEPDDLNGLSINEAEVFTALPREHQPVVMAKFRGTPGSDLKDLAKFAQRVAKQHEGELSATALRQSFERLDEELKRLKDRMTEVRLHHNLGPVNLRLLFADKKFRAAAIREGVNVIKWEKLVGAAA